jgi:hypothetical protein
MPGRFSWPLLLLFAGGLLAGVSLLAPRLVRSLPSRPPQSLQPAGASVPPPRPLGPRLTTPPSPLPPTVARPETAPEHQRQRGVSLGLFAEDVSFDYGPLLREIAALGATHVQLVVPVYQEHGGSTTLALHTRLSPSLAATAEAVRSARRVGLDVMLFPIVRLARPRTSNEWRGTLTPTDRDAWFKSYTEVLGDLAALAAMTGTGRLAVGSELSTLDSSDDDLRRWDTLLERIRALFPGVLVYSANWDHYKDARLLDRVDEAGVVAYFELRSKSDAPDVAVMERRWRELRNELVRWRGGRKQPFLLTEVGYRSRKGSTAAPWDETGGGEPDLEEQRRAFQAFRQVWATGPAGARADAGQPAPNVTAGFTPGFAGLYVWNWYGYGGPGTVSYTPRGKPAAAEVKALLEGL